MKGAPHSDSLGIGQRMGSGLPRPPLPPSIEVTMFFVINTKERGKKGIIRTSNIKDKKFTEPNVLKACPRSHLKLVLFCMR